MVKIEIEPGGIFKDFEKRPIRKRGFHRALKRGEAWAISAQKLSVRLQHVSVDMFDFPPGELCPTVIARVLEPSERLMEDIFKEWAIPYEKKED